MVSKKKQKTRNRIIVTVIAVVVVLLVIFGFQKGFFGPDSMLSLAGLYDEDGNRISQPGFSTVDGITGVAFVDFNIKVDSQDNRTIIVVIQSATPPEFEQVLPINQAIELLPGSTFTWTSSLLDIRPFEGQQVTFAVNIVGTIPGKSIKPIIEQGTITLLIDADPVGAGFTVGVSGSTGTGDIGGDTGDDTGGNGGPTFETNAIDGDYNVAGVWIKFDGVTQYFRSGVSSYSCQTQDIFINTPEGLPVCTRAGYDIAERVYVDDGSRGIIFKP